MDKVDEKAVIGNPVSGVYPGFKCGRTNTRNSAWCSGRRKKTNSVREGTGLINRSSLTGSQSCVDSAPGKEFTPRVQNGFGGVAGIPGLHRGEVGANRGKETGIQEMKTLVIAQQKGGVGKTSSIVHLAFDFLERGLRVAVIDLDTQGNASFTLHDFNSDYPASQMFDQNGDDLRKWFYGLPDGPLMRLIASDAVLANMEKRNLTDAAVVFNENITALADSGFDVVLIDTAPALGVALAAALYAADCVLSPIELEAYSIQGIKKMLTTIANVRKLNTKLKFIGIVASKVDARNPRHVRHQNELNAAYPQLMIPGGIGLRSSIADALASGVPVWKIKKTAARKATLEVRALAAYVYEKMEITQ
jgi:chromosome partitioning protein